MSFLVSCTPSCTGSFSGGNNKFDGKNRRSPAAGKTVENPNGKGQFVAALDDRKNLNSPHKYDRVSLFTTAFQN